MLDQRPTPVQRPGFKSILAILALCLLTGFVTGLLVEKIKVRELRTSLEQESSNLSLLTSSYVATYADIVRNTDNLPVPATMRAHTQNRFNDSYTGQERLVALMVGIPGKDIATPPIDEHLASTIQQMATADVGGYKSISTLTRINNEPTLRTVYPSVATKTGCVSCHNKIQNNRFEWKEDDLMGAYVIDRGVSGALSNIRFYATLVGLLMASLLLLSIVVIQQYLRLKAQSDDLQGLADKDPLTGCLNRRALLRISDDLHTDNALDGGLLMMDLDHFKKINDDYGHHIGDQVLLHFVGVVRSVIRDTDVFARVGGEEFVVYLRGTPVDLSERIAKRICVACADKMYHSNDGEVAINLTVSVGLVQMINTTNNIFTEWLNAADQLLYKAKESGRNQAWHLGPLLPENGAAATV